MTKKRTCVCDSCGKTSMVGNEDTALNWFRLDSIYLMYRKTAEEEDHIISERNVLRVNDDNDPDFCSLKCLLEWIKKEAIKIQKAEEEE